MITFLMLGSSPGRRRGAGRILAAVAVLLAVLALWLVATGTARAGDLAPPVAARAVD